MKQTQYVAREPDAQGFIHYPPEEHAVWNTLITRQLKVIEGRACQEYLDGIEKLGLPHDRIPQLSEINQVLARNGGSVGTRLVRSAMDDAPLTCTLETDMDEVRRMMLGCHARYMPVMDQGMLMGVVSFYDVAKAVVDSQNFENKLLKAYIRDWPQDKDQPVPQH